MVLKFLYNRQHFIVFKAAFLQLQEMFGAFSVEPLIKAVMDLEQWLLRKHLHTMFVDFSDQP